ncbi:hypothetical protein K439DRAFT_1361407 [Ramaria rubella]|nr:hypothetical protein K439DRAFT_1361407 [Ramaria rubella]
MQAHSSLSGYGWVQELIHSHPEQICCELRVHKHVFHSLVDTLRCFGFTDSQHVC